MHPLSWRFRGSSTSRKSLWLLVIRSSRAATPSARIAVDAATGSVVYAAFAASMTIGRFSGTVLLRRFSRSAVVRVGALLGAAGLAVVVFSPSAPMADVAVVLWGLGASLGFPTAISAAGDGDGDRSAAVSLVATSGYVAFLVGRPLLGFLGEHFGLRYAMVVVSVIEQQLSGH